MPTLWPKIFAPILDDFSSVASVQTLCAATSSLLWESTLKLLRRTFVGTIKKCKGQQGCNFFDSMVAKCAISSCTCPTTADVFVHKSLMAPFVEVLGLMTRGKHLRYGKKIKE